MIPKTLMPLFIIIFGISILKSTSYSGYVITNNDEKIEGKFIIKKTIEFYVGFTFKDKEKNTFQFSPENLKEYFLEVENKKFIVHTIENVGPRFCSVQFQYNQVAFLTTYVGNQINAKEFVHIYAVNGATEELVYPNSDRKPFFTNPFLSNKHEGAIVTVKGDTILGTVSLNETQDDQKIIFREKATGERKRYDADQIKGYFVKNEIFEKVSFIKNLKRDTSQMEEAIMKLLQDGPIKVYVNKKAQLSSTTYNTQTGFYSNEISYVYLKKPGKGPAKPYHLSSKKNRKLLYPYFPALQIIEDSPNAAKFSMPVKMRILGLLMEHFGMNNE